MRKTTYVSTAALWRFAPLAISFVLMLDYYMWVANLSCFQGVLITPERFFIPATITGIIAIITVFFPYQFYIHATFCLSLGLLQIIDGEMANALAVYIFGYVFLYRKGFFKSHKRLKLLAGGMLVAAAILSQARLDHDVTSRLIQLASIPVIIFLATVILRPELQAIHQATQDKRRDKTLTLRHELFTEKDVAILKKILAGHKYEAIAKEEGMVLSTFKKHTRRLFGILRVNDRITFMALYANHQIVSNKGGDAQPDARSESGD